MEAATECALKRAGHETLIIDDRRIKRAIGWSLTQRIVKWQAERFRPDFIFLSKCLALDVETVAHIIKGIPNAMWYHDPQWHKDTDRPDIGHIASVGKIADTFFITGFENEWRANGLNAKFLPAAGDADIVPVPRDEKFATDIAFIGTAYDITRANLLLQLAKRHQVRVYGLGWDEWRKELHWSGKPVEGKDFAKACSGCRIMMGINPARAAGEGGTSYTSDRTWMVMLAGGFYLGQGTPGLRKFLTDGEHCAWYSDAAECIEKADYYMNHPEERERIRVNGEKFVRAHHTYDQRIHNLLTGETWTNPL